MEMFHFSDFSFIRHVGFWLVSSLKACWHSSPFPSCISCTTIKATFHCYSSSFFQPHCLPRHAHIVSPRRIVYTRSVDQGVFHCFNFSLQISTCCSVLRLDRKSCFPREFAHDHAPFSRLFSVLSRSETVDFLFRFYTAWSIQLFSANSLKPFEPGLSMHMIMLHFHDLYPFLIYFLSRLKQLLSLFTETVWNFSPFYRDLKHLFLLSLFATAVWNISIIYACN